MYHIETAPFDFFLLRLLCSHLVQSIDSPQQRITNSRGRVTRVAQSRTT